MSQAKFSTTSACSNPLSLLLITLTLLLLLSLPHPFAFSSNTAPNASDPPSTSPHLPPMFATPLTRRLHRTEEWMGHFSDQLHSAFGLYTQSASVKTSLEEVLDRGELTLAAVEPPSEQEFNRRLARLRQRLDSFFAGKVAALRRLVLASEESAKQFDFGSNLTLPTRPPAPHSPNEAVSSECEEHKRLIDAQSVYSTKTRRKSSAETGRSTTAAAGSETTGVHVTLESYKCDPLVVKDFRWTNDPRIHSAMGLNGRNDSTISRQYVGTYSGLTRLYPDFQWEKKPERHTIDLFDPRFRPWFVGAESAPKDVLFLMDYSGSSKGQTIHLTKLTIMYILATLTPNDFFSGIWYNSRRGFVLAECCGNNADEDQRFFPATTRNKRLFRRYLDKLEERDQATLPVALNESFAEFLGREAHRHSLRHHRGDDSSDEASGGAEAEEDNVKGVDWLEQHSSGGHKLILLFTDGIEFWPTEVIREYMEKHPKDIIRVFGHSVGFGTGELKALDHISCVTQAGDYAIVDSIGDVRLKSRLYLSKPSEILSHVYQHQPLARRPITWIPPYMDAQKHGAVVTLSQPVLQRERGSSNRSRRRPSPADAGVEQKKQEGELTEPAPQGFLAVVGVDFRLDELRLLIERELMAVSGEGSPAAATAGGNRNNPNAYAFVVDNNGLVYYHPALRIPRREVYCVRRTACHRVDLTSTFHRSYTRVQFGAVNERVLKLMGLLDSIAHSHLLELDENAVGAEKSEIFRTTFYRRLIDGGGAGCGDGQNVLKDENDGKGEGWGSSRSQRREYRCWALRGTPFVVGLVRNLPPVGTSPTSMASDKQLVSLLISQSTGRDSEARRRKSNPFALPSLASEPLGYWLVNPARRGPSVGGTWRMPCMEELGQYKPWKRFHKLLQLPTTHRCLTSESAAASSSSPPAAAAEGGDNKSNSKVLPIFSSSYLMDPLAEWRLRWQLAAQMNAATTSGESEGVRVGNNGNNSSSGNGNNDKGDGKDGEETETTNEDGTEPSPIDLSTIATTAPPYSPFGDCDDERLTSLMSGRLGGLDTGSWVASFVDFTQAGLLAYTPRCRWRQVVRSFRAPSTLPSISQRLPRIVETNPTISQEIGQLAPIQVSVDPVEQTLMLIQPLMTESTTRDGDDAEQLRLVTFGTLLQADYLAERFRYALQANEKKGAMECLRDEGAGSGRECWLVSGDGYVLADSKWGSNAGRGKDTYKVRHLADKSPQLFGQMMRAEVVLDGGNEKAKLVQRVTVTDHQADCPMPKPFFHNKYQHTVMHQQQQQQAAGAASPRPTPSVNHLFNGFRALAEWLSALTYSLVWLDLSWLFAIHQQPLALADTFLDYGGECRYEGEDLVEQCSIRYTDYQLLAGGLLLSVNGGSGGGGGVTMKITYGEKEVETAEVGGDRTCSGQLSIIPYNSTSLYLFIVENPREGNCNAPVQLGKEEVEKNKFDYGENQVPDCNLTASYRRRRRPDLDYTRAHPEEEKRECLSSTSAAAGNISKSNSISGLMIYHIIPMLVAMLSLYTILM